MRRHRTKWTYRGESRDAIGQEVIVKRKKVRTTTRDKLDGGFDIQTERAGPFNGIQNLLRLSLEDVVLSGEMVAHRVGAIYFGGGGDIDQRNIGGQGRRLGIGQEGLVKVLKRHGH